MGDQVPERETPAVTHGHYDPRKAAANYAPIVASFGALAVTAIVVVFSSSTEGTSEQLAAATGLLAIAVLASFLGAFGLASIGAEDRPGVNQPAVILFHSVPVAISFISILGAFQPLAEIYIPDSTLLFSHITAAGGTAATIFMAFIVGDSYNVHPAGLQPEQISQWRATQWLKTRKAATGHAWTFTVAAVLIIGYSILLRNTEGHIGPQLGFIRVSLNAALIVTLAGSALGLLKSRAGNQPEKQRGLRAWEAIATITAVGFYTASVIVALPY